MINNNSEDESPVSCGRRQLSCSGAEVDDVVFVVLSSWLDYLDQLHHRQRGLGVLRDNYSIYDYDSGSLVLRLLDLERSGLVPTNRKAYHHQYQVNFQGSCLSKFLVLHRYLRQGNKACSLLNPALAVYVVFRTSFQLVQIDIYKISPN